MSIVGNGLFDQYSLDILKQISPNFDKACNSGEVNISITTTNNYGGNNMTDNRRIGNVTATGDNINVMGDDNHFNKVTGADTQDANKAYEELLTQIEKIQDENIRNLTKNITRELKEAIDQKASKKGKD